jgi:hypothetical protein
MSTDTQYPSTRSGGRPVNVGYLVVGLVFLGIAGVWALVQSGAVDSHQLGWLLPLTLVAAGAIGLVAIAARGLTRNRGGAVPVDAGDDWGHDDTEVHDLEAQAYAPYARDVERTRIIDEGTSHDADGPSEAGETGTDEGEKR